MVAARHTGPDHQKGVLNVPKSRRMLAAVAGVAAALTVLVPAALAGTPDSPDHAFACYSMGQGNPGVWAVTDSNVFAADGSYVDGYWAPYATEQKPIDTKTQTKVGDYYLTCSLPVGWAMGRSYVTSSGVKVAASAPWVWGDSAIPGVYPIATQVSAVSAPTT